MRAATARTMDWPPIADGQIITGYRDPALTTSGRSGGDGTDDGI
jgi:hypothetical protein